MSDIFAAQLAAVATAILALFAIVTAWYARRAFLKQSREVAAVERQVADGQEVARQQAELLRVHSGQLELQRRQFERDQDERRRSQASRVFVWTERGYDERFPDATASGDHDTLTVYVTNTSQQPVYDLAISWHLGDAPWETDGKDEESVLMPGSQWGVTRNLPPRLPLTAAGRRPPAAGTAEPRDSAMLPASTG
jgi:hypothetical protein